MRFFIRELKVLGAIFLSTFAYTTFKIYLLRRKYKHLPGPKTKGILEFYFGHYFTINKYLSQGNIIGQLQLQWSKEFGQVYVYQFLNEMVCITNEEESIKTILIDKNFPKKENIYQIVAYPFGQRFMGKGLVTELNYEKWRQRRSFLNHCFKKSVLIESLNEFNSKGDILIEKLLKLSSEDKSIQMLNEFSCMALDVIAKIAFDLNTNSINDREMKLNKYISLGFEAITMLMNDPFSQLKPSKLNKIKEIKSSIVKLRKYSVEIFNQKIKDFEESNLASKTMLSTLLKHAKTSNQLDFETLIDDFITFFIAGQETTANALSFCIFELGQNERVLKKLNEEVKTVLGQKTEITNDDLNKLVYTTAVFKESMRKWPPVPAVNRRAPEDVLICDKLIPKNAWFYVPQFIIGRNEKYFPKPNEFIPERFISDDEFSKENRITSYTYFPFSLGPRNCIGQNFAMLEGRVILAKFIQNFDFELDPNQSLIIDEWTTLRPRDGVKVYLKPKF
ncbi:unnamed protein product [Brachionus calyciflorus]|uniref:Cytochrome p450 n=1 Tax=Brachionus calyciflorus TaxID=104777 RepID=A0A813WW88_9BILA|nr:unnamed protein product [Brachionus calyciflorus]